MISETVFFFVFCHRRALSIKREPNTLQLLGVLYYHENLFNEAELAWKEAIQLDPSNVETRSNYVSIHFNKPCVYFTVV